MKNPESRIQNPDQRPNGHAGPGPPAVEEGRPAPVRPVGPKSTRAKSLRTPDPSHETLPHAPGLSPYVQDPRSKIQDLRSRLHGDQSGLSGLEKLGLAAIVISVLAFIPAARGLLGDAYDAVFKQEDEQTGEVSSFSIAARGVLIVIVAVVAFLGSVLLLLYTNLGRRLAFLVAGAAVFGWLTIGGGLFIMYAPRGLRPRNLEGLNAFQVRVPAIAMTLGALVLFVMFIVALDKYEKESEEA